MPNPNERAKDQLSDNAKRLAETHDLTPAEAQFVERRVEAGVDEQAIVDVVKKERVARSNVAGHEPGGNTAPPNINAPLTPEAQLANLERERDELDRRIRDLTEDIENQKLIANSVAEPEPVEMTVENGEIPVDEADLVVAGEHGGTLRTKSGRGKNAGTEVDA